MQTGRIARPAPAGRPGWTVLEALLVVTIIAIVLAAAVPLLRCGRTGLQAAEPKILTAQEARTALASVTAALRQARAVTALTDNGAGAASLSFLAADGTPWTFGRSAASSQLLFGPVGSPAVLAGHCSALSIRGYGRAGQLLPAPLADPTGIASTDIILTVTDPLGRGQPMTFTTRAALQSTRHTVVINEVMYKPPSALGPKDKNQWVELYNASPQSVDVNGWYLWTKGQTAPDTLQRDALYSTGSTVLAPGQYAIVTDRDSELYREVLRNGDFESSDMSMWKFEGTWQRISGGAYSGSYKIEPLGTGWVKMWQDFKIPSDRVNPKLLVRARLAAGSISLCRLRIRITDRNDVVLMTVYDGQFTGAWTTYTADLTPVINVDARLDIRCYMSSYFDEPFLDAMAIYSSRLPTLPPNCLHLWVNDDTIGKDLEDCEVYLSSGLGGPLHSVIVWETAWGGNGDGSTLARVSPYSPPTEQTSWRPGPYGGTPAQPN